MSSTMLLKTNNYDNILDHLNETFDDESETLIPEQPPLHPSDLIEQAKKSPLPLPLPIALLRQQLKSTRHQ